MARKIIAILLLFLFLEKVGLRLIIHNHYHEHAISTLRSKDGNPIASLSSQYCDCLDDFFIPLDYTEGTILKALPSLVYIDVIQIVSKSHIYTSHAFSFCLRGPPFVS